MEVKIIKFDHFGRGIGYINDKIIFISRALPEEIVNIKIVKEKSKFSEGKIINIIKPNNERVDSICPYYDKCGGCDFLHTNDSMEKGFKINKAKELLGRCDNYYETDSLNYRNKVTLHVKDNKIGFYEEGTNNLIPIDYCYLLNNKINDTIKIFKDINKDNIKEIIIKTNGKDILVNIKGNIDSTKLPFDNLIINNKLINGKDYIEEVIDNKVFKITSNAFFQVNREGLLNINSIIHRFVKDKKINKALDLYSGIGLWGILISNYVNDIACIEINKEACLNAKENIKKNDIKNIKVINGKVEDYIDQFNNIDLIITDPPRSGLDKKTIGYLKKIKAQYFIYVSCDMYTLKRDLKDLEDIYEIKEINLVNMFKKTYHVESVCLLSRKTVDK